MGLQIIDSRLGRVKNSLNTYYVIVKVSDGKRVYNIRFKQNFAHEDVEGEIKAGILKGIQDLKDKKSPYKVLDKAVKEVIEDAIGGL